MKLDVLAPRPGKEGKTFWHRVGTAINNEKGTTVFFDSLPLPDDKGRVSVILREPKPRTDDPPRASIPNPGASAYLDPRREMDDEIPF